MTAIDADNLVQYDALLVKKQVPQKHLSYFRMWVRSYLAFCGKQGVPEQHPESPDRFILSLAEQGKAPFQQKQAAQAVAIYNEPLSGCDMPEQLASKNGASVTSQHHDGHALTEAGAPVIADFSDWKQVYAELFNVIRTRHYSQKTLKTYTTWLRHFQGFMQNKEPSSLTPIDVKTFLNYLAIDRRVAASTQNQAFNALLFLFRHILRRDFGDHRDTVRAKSKPYIPVVLSRQEVDAVLDHLRPPYDLVVKLLYGCGLRLFECVKLRLHNFNFDAGILTVHDGKGQKDRTVPLPQVTLPALKAQIELVKKLHDEDLRAGYAGVFMDSQRRRNTRLQERS